MELAKKKENREAIKGNCKIFLANVICTVSALNKEVLSRLTPRKGKGMLINSQLIMQQLYHRWGFLIHLLQRMEDL